jgi:uncharacterized protein (DUF2336 family)
MAEKTSVLGELEDAIKSGSQEQRVQTLRRITDLFLSGADRFNDPQIELFDDVLCHLIKTIETKAMAELSSRLAPVDNAPIEVIRQLARDEEIAVAGPVLTQSARLTTSDLLEIAGTKGNDHLLAISGRSELDETLTDVLLDRGAGDVRHMLAGNGGARFSEAGFTTLVNAAEADDSLAEKICSRLDLPVRLLRDLLLKATEAVRGRLFAVAPLEAKAEIEQVLTRISSEVGQEAAAPRDFKLAIQTVASMQERGTLNEATLAAFATERKYEEVVAALSALCSVSVDMIAPLMKSIRYDGLLVACKAAELRWATVAAILQGRAVRHSVTEAELSGAKGEYLRLSQSSAQRTFRFWKVRVGSTRRLAG